MPVKRPLLILFITSLLVCVVGSNIQVQASEKPEYFFFVHMIAPTSNPVRMQYAQLMEGELPKIGIGAELSLISWAALGPRCTDQEVGMYSEGGYDICFIGSAYTIGCRGTTGPFEVLRWLFGSEEIPPSGLNVGYWSSELEQGYNNYRAQESDDLLEKITTNLNLTEVKYDIHEWQKLWYDTMPNVLIYNQYEVQAISTGLYGYDPVQAYPLLSIEDMWTTIDYLGGDQVVAAASTAGATFNPMIATDVYDQYMSAQSFDGLYGRTPSKEAVLPTGTNRATWMTDNYGTTDYLALVPRMATKMGNYSANGLSYQVDMRDDIYFHDGHKADMWDLAMSFQAQMTPDVASSVYSNIVIPFGLDNKTGKHGNYSFVVSDPNGDGHDERINITLATTFAPFEGDYLGQSFYPEHILGDPVTHGFTTAGDFDPNNLWITKPADWKYHSTTTGRNTDPGGYEGPISVGSMIFKNFDSTTGFATLQKFNQTKWDNATSAWVTDTSVSHWNIDALDKMPNNAKVIVASMDSALADLKTGGVNIMDVQFTMANILDELQVEATIQAVLSPETGWQAIYMNPKFEQDGVHHLAKKGVRHAISHMVPREDIITYLMNGMGSPAFTPVPVSSWEAISEAELINYKQNLEGTDGSKPLAKFAITAYDQYSPYLAFNWLDTEGYNTTKWRQLEIEPLMPPDWRPDLPYTSTNIDTTPIILGFLFVSVLLIIIYISGYIYLMRKK